MFIGCSAITIPSIKSPPKLSYVLLGLWIVSVILTNALNDGDECLVTHYAIPLVFTIILVLVSIVFSKMNWVFFATIVIIGIVLAVSLGICIDDGCEPIVFYSFFAFDLGLFTWWCWLTLSSHAGKWCKLQKWHLFFNYILYSYISHNGHWSSLSYSHTPLNA